MDFGNEAHVPEDIRVAHVIDCGLARGLDDDAIGVAEREGDACLQEPRGMIGPHERHREAALVRRAARVHGVEGLQALRGEPHAHFEVRHDLGAGRLRYLQGVTDVVAMPMRDEDVRDALDGLIPAPPEGRIVGEEGVDQDDVVGEVEAKCTVSEPGDLHAVARKWSFRVSERPSGNSAHAVNHGRSAESAEPDHAISDVR
jgi:hypothetical protein